MNKSCTYLNILKMVSGYQNVNKLRDKILEAYN